jgi:RHS repeat-associated protein
MKGRKGLLLMRWFCHRLAVRRGLFSLVWLAAVWPAGAYIPRTPTADPWFTTNATGWFTNSFGSLSVASDPTGSGVYSYDTAGLLTNRWVGTRTTAITSRDGEGRPLSIATTVSAMSQLTESLTWSGDGLLATHTLARADFTDSRAYAYADLSRRLVQEQLNLNGSATWTNHFAYDSGTTAGPGVLTQMGAPGSGAASWSGGVSPLSRINTETNTAINYPAYGRVNGQATVMAFLDSEPLSVITNSSGDTNYPIQWRAMMELTPGAHQLKAAALHPSGFYTAWATNWFTNNLAHQTAAVGRDADGNVTMRTWKAPDGSVLRQQQLWYDAKNRLVDVFDGDGSQNGFYLHAEYDGLNRRLLTRYYPMINGQINYSVMPSMIYQYYDPQVEFLELGVSYGETTEWKLYGPDLSGTYGGLNGVGGLDAVSPYLNTFNPVISDYRGNILGEATNGAVAWNPSRPTGYGTVPGYRPPALGHGADIVLASTWRGRWPDVTGYYNLGLRLYDPVAGMWLSYDSTWNARDPNYLTFAGGDPINGFDSDGRLGKGFYYGLTGQGVPANASSAFMSGYYGGGVTAGFGQGLGQGAENTGIGAWDAAKGTVQAGWAFTGGTAVNLWNGDQTIYGAIGNNVYNLATSSEARANAWNGVSSYVSDTFSNPDLFSQRVGGSGLITLATLGAGEVAQGLRAGGAAAEGADALSAGQGLVHLTDTAGATGISEAGSIVGRNGIFAVPSYVADESTAMKVLRTGLTPARTTEAVPIPSAAEGLFQQPVPIGPYSAWKYFGGVRYTSPGAISTATGAFTPVPSLLGPGTLIYGPDALFWGGVGTAGAIYGQSGGGQ